MPVQDTYGIDLALTPDGQVGWHARGNGLAGRMGIQCATIYRNPVYLQSRHCLLERTALQ
jgi:hypothetical protein